MLNMKFERQKARLTQIELAEKIGARPDTISKYESEFIDPSLKVLRKISEVLGVSIDDLVRRI